MSEWLLYREDNGIVGPVDSRLVLDGIADGRVPGDTRVRAPSETAWRTLERIPVFALALRQAPPLDASLRRPVFDGFDEAMAEAAHSLRPVHHTTAWDAGRPSPAPSRRMRAGTAIGAGVVLGMLAVLLIARSTPSRAAPRLAARAQVRSSAIASMRRVIRAIESQEQPAPPEERPSAPPVVHTGPRAPVRPRVPEITEPGF